MKYRTIRVDLDRVNHDEWRHPPPLEAVLDHTLNRNVFVDETIVTVQILSERLAFVVVKGPS